MKRLENYSLPIFLVVEIAAVFLIVVSIVSGSWKSTLVWLFLAVVVAGIFYSDRRRKTWRYDLSAADIDKDAAKEAIRGATSKVDAMRKLRITFPGLSLVEAEKVIDRAETPFDA